MNDLHEPSAPDRADRETRLLRAIREGVGARHAYVCFSGGIDSTLVLAACLRAQLPTTALIGVSASLPRAELAEAHRLAMELGAPIEEVPTGEMELDEYRANSGDRCFHCKTTLYESVGALAAARGAAGRAAILAGTHLDDLGEHRPGLRAGSEHAVLTPLVSAGFRKSDVRSLARAWKLSNAEKPAAPCLASRLPVGVEVTPQRLEQVEGVEDFLRAHGLWPARARWHGAVVRIELPPELFPRILEEPARGELHRRCSELGFRFVALDLAGLQSGSLAHSLV
ncbi:MAG: ATP-dependent sacrificial sulfur transferase LarE [Gemmatimonadota bacterium]|nr:ATP-dependent sacrificial sulfur transferase LarE [Gemmatimonadota bacterium]